MRIPRLLALLSVFGLALHAATWPLWRVPSPYPQVPLFWLADAAPFWLETASAWVCVLALGVLLAVRATKGARSLCLASYLAAVCVLAAIDQHRIQAWTYQFCLLAFICLLLDTRRALAMARLLVASIYLYSAWSKLDYVFLHTLGIEFARTLLAFALRPDDIARIAPNLAWVFPAGEFAVGLGLYFSRTRKIAVVGAIFIHLALLAILGPWGLNHQYGVLLWNGFFLGLVCILFGGSSRKQNKPEPEAAVKQKVNSAHPNRAAQWLATVVVVGTVLAPLGSCWGLWDHWPSWALYAPGGERLTILIHQEGVARLPPALRQYLDQGDGPWLRFRPDLWSLKVLRAPAYPQNRCRLGVAVSLARNYELGPWIQAIVATPANRFTGQRRSYRLVGAAQMASYSARYFFNARPRVMSCPTENRIGSTFRQVYVENGQRMEMHGVVTGYESNRRLTLDISGDAFDLFVDYRLEDLGGRTRLTQDSVVRFKGCAFKIIGVLMTPFIKKSSREQLAKGFAKLKALAETSEDAPAAEL